MLLIVVLVLVAITLAIPATGQVPYLRVYFDARLTEEWGYCPSTPGTIDTLYVGAMNLDMRVSSVEFSIEYPSPSTLVWVGDVHTSPLFLGQSPTGVAISWPIPRDAHHPLLVMRAVVVWMCTYNCYPYNIPMRVRPHPGTGTITAVRWPDYHIIEPYGLASMICPIIATEETTWGRVKALYQ